MLGYFRFFLGLYKKLVGFKIFGAQIFWGSKFLGLNLETKIALKIIHSDKLSYIEVIWIYNTKIQF